MLVCHFGTFSDFLSTVSVNCFSTHLLTTENHKPAVMLRVLCVAYKRAYGPFVKFAHSHSFTSSHWTSFIFSYGVFCKFFVAPQLTECLGEATHLLLHLFCCRSVTNRVVYKSQQPAKCASFSARFFHCLTSQDMSRR